MLPVNKDKLIVLKKQWLNFFEQCCWNGVH